MKKRITLISVVIAMMMSMSAKAQDIHFSQFDETPLLLNPANTGAHHDIEAILNYKNQWKAVAVSPYSTFDFAADFKLMKKKKHHMGLGFYFFNDKAGDAQVRSTDFQVHLSGIISINEKSLISAGLMAGMASRTLGNTHLQWGDQYNGMNYDASIPSGEPIVNSSFIYPDLGAGIQYSYGTDEIYISANNSRKVNIGCAIFHPNQPAYSFYGDASDRLHMKFVLHGDAAIGIANTNVILKPSYIFFRQGATQEITPGLTIMYVLHEGSVYTGNKKPAAVSLGGYYRIKDAAIAMVKFEYANYSIGFSYDINMSELKTVSNLLGGFELSLRFIAPNAFTKSRRTTGFF
jgi:type IX secretion system PorP/SprF family membrane protein